MKLLLAHGGRASMLMSLAMAARSAIFLSFSVLR